MLIRRRKMDFFLHSDKEMYFLCLSEFLANPTNLIVGFLYKSNLDCR